MAGECCEGSSLWQGEEQVTFMLGPRLHELQQGLRYELSQLEELIGTLPGCEPLPLKEERWIGPLPRKEEPLAHVRKEVPLVQAGKQEALAIAEQVEARALGPELHLSCPRRVASPLQEEQGSTLLAAIAEDDTGDDARHLQGKRTSWGQLAPPRKVSNLSDSDGGLPEGNSTRSLLSAGPPMTPPPPLLNRGSSCAAIVAKRGKEGSKERVKVARRGGSDMVRQSSPSSVPEDSEFTGAELPRHQFQSYSYLGSELCANDSANSIQSLLSKGPDGHLIGPHRASEVESPLVDRVQFPPYLRGMSGIPDRGRSKSPERRPSIGTSGGGSDAGTDVFRLSSNTSIMMDLEDQKRLQLARKRQISDHLKAAKNAGKPNKHGLVSKFVQSSRFEITFGIAIVMSALLSGVEAQWMSDHIGQDQPLAFFLLRQLLTFIFVIELFFRIWADGLCNFFCSSSWYWGWLDLVVVIISLVELTFDLLLMQGLVGKNGTNNIGELRVIRAIRITRLARAFRLQRLIRFIASLRTLVYSISVTLKSLFWAMVLLLMIMYVFAISFTQYASEYRGEPDVDQHFSDLHAEIPKFFCEGVTGSLDWTAVRMDVHRWAKHRRKEYADANLTEVQVSLSGHLFTMMHSVTNQQSAQEECQFGFYCLMASQAIAASNMRTHFVRPYEFSLRNLLATVPFFEVSACGWPIFSTLTIFADLNKGEVFFTTGDRKYLRTFSDWNLRRDELSPLLRSDLDFLSPAWRTAAEASIEALVALPHAGYVRAIRDGVRHRENVDGPLREIVLQLVDVAVMVSAYAPPEHRLVYVVLLYGKNWSGILGRMARRFHQLGIRYPLLAVSVGAEAAASCRQIAAASGAPGTEHNIGKVICWTPGSESQVHRFTAVHALIHLGIDVIYMDMDTFMLRDPGPRILEQAEGYDAAFARHADADCINIGVFFLRAGPRTAVWFSQFVAWYHDHPFEIDQRGLQVFLGLPAKKVQIAFPPEDLVKVRSTVLEDVNEVVIANIGWHGHLSKLLIFHWCQLPLEQKLGQILAAYDAADAAEEHGLPLALAVVGAATPASGGSGAWAKVLQLQSIFRLAQKSEPPERSPCW